MEKVDSITRFCFAMETPELAKLLLGIKEESRWTEEGEVLTSSDTSSLVIDRLGDRTRGQGVTVAGFYF